MAYVIIDELDSFDNKLFFKSVELLSTSNFDVISKIFGKSVEDCQEYYDKHINTYLNQISSKEEDSYCEKFLCGKMKPMFDLSEIGNYEEPLTKVDYMKVMTLYGIWKKHNKTVIRMPEKLNFSYMWSVSCKLHRYPWRLFRFVQLVLRGCIRVCGIRV